jgi:CheY-like chemotaxis protein
MRKQILLVESNRAMRLLVHTVLKRHYRVVAVPDGLAAMAHLREGESPDLIILDPDLPDMQDWELVAHLSLNPLYSSIPKLVISSLGEYELRAQAMKYNLADCFSKPFNPLKLIEAVDTLLLGSRMRRA